MDQAIENTATSIFSRTLPDGACFSPAQWSETEEAGLTLAGVPDTAGGIGAGLASEGQILVSAGYHGASLPIAETMLCLHVLAQAGLALPSGPLALVRSADGQPTFHRVPFGRHVAGLVLQGGKDNSITVFEPGTFQVAGEGRNLADEPRDLLVADSSGNRVTLADLDWIEPHAALQRAALMAGALRRILDMTVQYANQRKQFGRNLSQFQAIQQQVSVLATEAAAADVAVRSAYAAAEPHTRLLLSIVAKIRTGEAAAVGVPIAHQVHGAIGITSEYSLERFTRRLMAWRMEDGSDRAWSDRLGRHLQGGGSARLWDTISNLA
jgi:acyl-CoA dehydrogenase